MKFQELSLLSEEQFQEFLRLKRRKLMAGKVWAKETCNRLNRRRWTRKVLRKYRLLWKKLHEQEQPMSETE